MGHPVVTEQIVGLILNQFLFIFAQSPNFSDKLKMNLPSFKLFLAPIFINIQLFPKKCPTLADIKGGGGRTHNKKVS